MSLMHKQIDRNTQTHTGTPTGTKGSVAIWFGYFVTLTEQANLIEVRA